MTTPDFTKNQLSAGHAIYTPRTLAAYDSVVLGLSNPLVWACPTRRILDHYNQFVSANHLDVGVGTGYFPDRCRFPSDSPRIALLDANSAALKHAARRIARYQPETFRRNVLEPIEMECDKFDSIGVNYVLHCLPGNMESKAIALDHLICWMNPGAVLFGSTILHDGVRRGWPARQLMRLYNRKGIFCNQHDVLVQLVASLNQRLRSVAIQIVGCVALFSGRI